MYGNSSVNMAIVVIFTSVGDQGVQQWWLITKGQDVSVNIHLSQSHFFLNDAVIFFPELSEVFVNIFYF